MTPRLSAPACEVACTEKWRLVDQYVGATRDIINIKTRRAAAIDDGRDDLVEFDLQLKAARKTKDEALERYARHIQGHGC